MVKRKNHHFVPQFYFRRFSPDGKSICLLRKSTGFTTPTAPIRSQSSQALFYGDDTVEAALGKIESVSSRMLHDLSIIKDVTKLSDEHFHLLFLWITLQRTRTAASRNMTKAMADKWTHMNLEVMINNDDSLSEEKRARLITGIPIMQADPVAFQRMMMGAAMEEREQLLDLRPIMLINKTNRPFVFGDAPVVFYNGFYRNVKLRGVLGFATPGLMVSYPLAPNLSLLLLDDARYKLKRVRDNKVKINDLRDVMALNKLQIHASASCIYFNDIKFDAYVREIWQQERQKLTSHSGRVIEAPSFAAENGEPLGDVVHSFEPQLPYRLSLSFISHPIISDDKYRFDHR